jgi:hypothetical protein
MLFSPKPARLRPAATAGDTRDRVPDSRYQGTPEALRQQLFGLLGEEKVLHKISDLVRYASDAGSYRLVPQAVVVADGIEDIAKLFRFAHVYERKLVFRAGGSSLNGRIVDSIVWAAEHLLPNLVMTHQLGTAVVHPTCSTRHLGDVDALRDVAAACAVEVTVPAWAECCGFAGDRGMLHKELTESASAHECAEILSVMLDLERATRPESPAKAATTINRRWGRR